MKIDYKKLTEDLIKARIAAEEAAKGEDGGAANLDVMTIGLPGAREKKGYYSSRSCRVIYKR